MNKTWWTVVWVAVVAVVGGVWWLYNSLDSVVTLAVRTYGPEITGVRVTLDSVKIQPTDGVATLRGLELGNPDGFKTARALAVGQISMTLDVASLTKDVVRIKEITVEQPELTYEYASGGSNFDVIQRHIESYLMQKLPPKDTPKTQSEPPKLLIDHLYIKGAYAQVTAEILQGKSVRLPLPDLHLTDIGKKTHGASAAEVAQQVMGAMAKNLNKAVTPLHLGGAADSVKQGAARTVQAIQGLFK